MKIKPLAVRIAGFGLAGLMTALSTGCGSGNDSLPSSVNIELPDGAIVTANRGSGVGSVSDSSWTVYRESNNAAAGIPLVVLKFDSSGVLTSFENNTIASDVFGSTILFDGQTHPTNQPNLSYAAATYGAENQSGLGFNAQLAAFAAGFTVATGSASAIGSFTDENTIRGLFSFRTQATQFAASVGGDLATQANQEDTFQFIAIRQ